MFVKFLIHIFLNNTRTLTPLVKKQPYDELTLLCKFQNFRAWWRGLEKILKISFPHTAHVRKF